MGAPISGAQAAAPAVGISQPGGRGKEREGNVGAIVFYGQNLKRSLPVTLPARTSSLSHRREAGNIMFS